jgi:uncharacterized protein
MLLYLPKPVKNIIDGEISTKEYSNIDIEYYKSKLSFLIKNKFFGSTKYKTVMNKRLSAKHIKKQFASLNHIVFEVTENCNLKCKYCIYGDMYQHYDKRITKNLSAKRAKLLIDHLVKLWLSPNNLSINTTKLISFYGGEPLLNFKFISEIVDYSKEIEKQTNIKFEFNMTTNGTLLLSNIDFFVKNNFQIAISLDGDEYSNQYRIFKNNEPAFNIIESNISELKNKYPVFFETNVVFMSVFHDKSNYTEIKDFFQKKFNKSSNFSELNPLINEEYANIKSKTIINNIKNPISEYKEHFYHAKYNFYVDLLDKTPASKSVPTGTCYPFEKMVFLTANNKLLFCQSIPHKYTIGNVSDSGVNINFKEIAQLYSSIFDKIKNQCAGCYMYKHCRKCIFYFDEKYNCDEHFNEIKFSKVIAKYINNYEISCE